MQGDTLEQKRVAGKNKRSDEILLWLVINVAMV